MLRNGRPPGHDESLDGFRSVICLLALVAGAPAAAGDWPYREETAQPASEFWAQPVKASWLSGTAITVRGVPTGSQRFTAEGVSVSRLTPLHSGAHQIGFGPVEDRLHLLVVSDDLRAIRYGIGVDLKVPGFGKFHLNLHSRDNPRHPGKRWSVLLADAGAGEAGLAHWSLGGSLKLVRPHRAGDGPGGERRFMFVPQLVLDVDGLLDLSTDTDALVQYASWRTADGDVMDERALQIGLKLRF